MSYFYKSAFTLLEIIMVIVIIGILAAVAVPKFINMRQDAMLASVAGSVAALRSGISMEYSSISMYDYTQQGSYPSYAEIANNMMNRNNGTYTAGIINGMLPPNVFDGDGDQFNVVNAAAAGRGTIIGTTGGWAYKPSTGEIWANTDVAGENYL